MAYSTGCLAIVCRARARRHIVIVTAGQAGLDDVQDGAGHRPIVGPLVFCTLGPGGALCSFGAKRLDRLQKLAFGFRRNVAAAVIEIGDVGKDHDPGKGLGRNSSRREPDRHENRHEENERRNRPSRHERAPASPYKGQQDDSAEQEVAGRAQADGNHRGERHSDQADLGVACERKCRAGDVQQKHCGERRLGEQDEGVEGSPW